MKAIRATGIRFWWVWAMALLCLTPLPAAEEAEFGIVYGQVLFEEDIVAPNYTVRITVNGTALPPITASKDGTFSGVLRAGDAVIVCGEQEFRTRIVPGEVNRLTLKLERKGVLITVLEADGKPAAVPLSAAYRAPGGDKMGVRVMSLAPGKSWIPEMPDDITALSIIAYGRGVPFPYYARSQWTFPAPAERRNLTITLERLTMVHLQVVNAQGAPVANTELEALLRYPRTSYQFWDLPEGADQTAGTARAYLKRRRTNDAGLIEIGLLPTGNYEVTFSRGKVTGKPIEFDVKGDGTITVTRYTFDEQAAN